MAERRSNDQGRKIARSETGALVRAQPVRAELTQAELRRLTDDVVDFANQAVRQTSLAHEALANYLLKALFDNDPARALSHDKEPTPLFTAVRERAGKSLVLSRSELSEHVRIGALNQLSRDGAWLNLEWTKKRELLPLLALDDGRKAFRSGVTFANRPNVGVLQLREWVQRELPRQEGSVGRPRGLTLAAGSKVLQTGVKLGDAEARRALAKRLREAPVARRREFARDLRATIDNLGKLLRDLEQPEE